MDLFISYGRADAAKAKELRDRLVAEGYEVFGDWSIHPGDSWSVALTRALKQCRLVVVLCSEASMRSQHVLREITIAGRRDDEPPGFLPVFLERTEIAEEVEYWLATAQWINTEDRGSNWMTAVVQAVEHKLGPRVPTTDDRRGRGRGSRSHAPPSRNPCGSAHRVPGDGRDQAHVCPVQPDGG